MGRTDHLNRYTAYTQEVPDVLLHQQFAVQRVEAPAEQVDGEIVPGTLLACSPQCGQALEALQGGVKCALVLVCRTCFVNRLEFESDLMV